MQRAFVLVLALTLGVVLARAETASAWSISNDTVNKVVTITGTSYTMKFNYNGKARVTSFVVNGVELFDQSTTEGIYTASRVGSTWYSSQTGVTTTVTVLSNTVTADFSTGIDAQRWTFTVSDPSVTLQVRRTYNGSYSLIDQGSPMISFAEHAFDNIRTKEDGGNLPIDGNLINTYQTNWLATGAKLNPNVRLGKEQLNYTLLNEPTNLALKISGTTNNDTLPRGKATQFYRADPGTKNFRLAVITSGNGLTYPGSPYGYAGSGVGGFYTQNGNPIYDPVSVSNGTVNTVTMTFTPDSYAPYYDLGTLKGVDQFAIARMIHTLGRTMMQDKDRGASFEGGPKSGEVPPLEMHWIGAMIELFPDAVNAYKAGLNDIKNYLQDSVTGEVKCCRPGLPDLWGIGRPDQSPGYVLGIVSAHLTSGDGTWLSSMKTSAEKALDYTINNQADPTTRLLKHAAVNDCSHCGVYWEVTAGTFSGYATAMMYDALIRWAQLERHVLGDSAKATTYENIAATMKTNFNKTFATGGFWSEAADAYFHASGVAETAYLATQGAVIKGDITTRERNTRIVDSYEKLTMRNNTDFHATNYWNIYNASQSAPDDPPSQNGSFYGAQDGDFFVGLPLLNDPVKIPTYIAAMTNRYYADGFYNCAGNYSRFDWFRCGGFNGDYSFAYTMLPVWGLYRSGYGFQPRYNELVIAPFISTSMVGSVVKYTWRNQPITVTYNSKTSFTIAASTLPTNIRVQWINQTPGATYTYTVNGGSGISAVADSAGTVSAVMSTAGTRTYNCTNCSTVTEASGGTSLVTAVNLNGAPLRNDANMNVGLRFTVGSSNIVVNELGRYFVAGNKRAHLLKLVDSAGQTVASTHVNMAEGSADSLGFKYGRLAAPTTLVAGKTYYLMSTEVSGGDTWYDTQVLLTTTSAASVNSGVFGLSNFNHTGGSGNSYVPLNLKYTTFASTTNVDDANAAITYSGSWSTTTDPGYYLSTTHFTNTPGDFLEYTFTGTSIRFFGGTYWDHGKIWVYIDNKLMTPAPIDMYSATRVRSTLLYSKNGLSSGSHTIKIVLAGPKNPASTNFYLDADKFEVSS